MTTKELNLQAIEHFFNNDQILQIAGRSGFIFSNGKGGFARLENHKDYLLIEIKKYDGDDRESLLKDTIDYYDSGNPIYKDFNYLFISDLWEDSLQEYKDLILNKLNQ